MWGSSLCEFHLGVPGQMPKLLSILFCQDILVCIQWLLKNTIAGAWSVLHEVVVLGSIMCLSQVFLNVLFCAEKVPCFMMDVGKWCWLDSDSPLDFIQVFTTSQDTSIWDSQGHVSGLHAGQKRKGLSNFIQNNMRAKTLSMVKNQCNWGKAEMWRDIENLFSGQFSNPWLPQARRNLNCRMKKWYIVQIPWQYAENITSTHLNYSVAWRRTFFRGNRFSFHTSIGAESVYIGWKFDPVFSSYPPACSSQCLADYVRYFQIPFCFQNSVSKNMCTILANKLNFWAYDTSDFTSCKDWQEYPH